MVTGDNKVTAEAIARECNLIGDDHRAGQYTVMEGPKFAEVVGGLKTTTVKGEEREEIVNKEVFAQIR